MGKPPKKDVEKGEDSEDRERQRLKKIAFSQRIISRVRENPRRRLHPSKIVVRSDGKDILKKAQRKNKHLFAFPCLLAPVSGGKMGELSHLDTKNPVLYVDFPQGRLKFFGTIIYPKNKYHTLSFPRGSGNIVSEDSFDSMVVFSYVWWIGTKEENPEELKLDFPEELNQKKHAEFDFKGGAGDVSNHKDNPNTELPVKDEPLFHDIDSKLDESPTKSTLNGLDEESKTPVRSSSRTAGKSYKFVDSPSEDDRSNTGSDTSSSNIEKRRNVKRRRLDRDFDNMLEDEAGRSVAISPEFGHDKIEKVLTVNAETAPASAQKTSSRKKTKESIKKSESVATKGALVQSSLSSFLHKSVKKNLQSGKTSLETKGSPRRKRSTDSKEKVKKKKDSEEQLSEEDIVEEVDTTPKQGGRRRSGRVESASKTKKPQPEQKSSNVEELSSDFEENDDSDDDWSG